MENKTKDWRRFMTDVLESSACAMFLADLDGRVTFANRSFHSLFGMPGGSCAGKPLAELLKEPERVSQALETLRDGHGWIGELQAARLDGAPLRVYACLSMVTDAAGIPAGLMGSFMDVTAYKRAEMAERDRTARMLRQQRVCLDLTRRGSTTWLEDIRRITEAGARTLGVERVSVWLFSEGGTRLGCEDLYLLGEQRHERGAALNVAEYPNYFASVRESRVLATPVVQTDPRTSEFRSSYLEPRGIVSMMDVSIRHQGELIGVLCFEHTGTRREWSLEEQEFGAAMADMASMAYAADERGRAKETLRRNEAFLHGVFDAFQDGISVLDRGWNIVRVNKWVERTRAERMPVTGRKCYEAYHGRDSICPWCPTTRTLETGEASSGVVPYSSKARPKGWLMLSSFPLLGDSGEVVGAVEHVKDITAQKLTEEALQDSEARFRELFNSMKSGVAVYKAVDNGKDFVFKDFNAAAERIDGVRREELLGRSVREAFPGVVGMGLFEVLKRVCKTGRPEAHPHTLYKDKRIVGWRENYVYKLPGGEVVSIYDDVTERMRSEEALRKSEERYRTLFESSREGMAATNLGGHITDCNPVFAEMLGQGTGDLVGMRYQDLVPKRWKTLNQDAVRQALERGYSDVFEKELQRKDGSLVPVALRAWRIKDEAGKPAGVWVMVRDISLRKKAEDALLSSESRLKVILSSMHDMVFVFDEEGRFATLFHTPSADPLYSSPAKFLGKKHSDVMPAGVHKLFSEAFKKNKKGLVAEYEYSMEVRSATRWYSAKLSPLFVEERFNGAVAVVRDITDRKASEEALRASEEKWRSLVESSGSIILIVDRDGTIHFINRTVTGADPAKVCGTKLYEYLHPESRDTVRETLHRVFDTGEPARYEARGEGTHQPISWYQTDVGPIKRDGKVVAAVLTSADVTESKRAEAKLFQAQKLASIGQLAAGVAHEINNPLAALSGEVQWLLEKTSDKKLVKSLKFMDRVSQRIASIVSHLLTFSRETPAESKEPCALNVVIEHALALMERRFEQTGVELGKDLAKDLPDLRINRGRMEQVFMNILLNSFDAMPKGGRLGVKSRLTKDGAWAEAVIEDNGVGVAEADLPRIFDPFYTTKPPGKGTGLGLSVSHGIVTGHGGVIELESRPGKGTRVSIRLPVER
ncbi:MAG: PAS domain S-box protein [Elusimicrobiota bacterium]